MKDLVGVCGMGGGPLEEFVVGEKVAEDVQAYLGGKFSQTEMTAGRHGRWICAVDLVVPRCFSCQI